MEEEKREESGTQERTFFEQPQTVRSSLGGNRAPLIALVLIVLLALGAGGWFILKGQSGSSTPTASPAPQIEISTPEPTTPPSIDKKEIKIEIQNGSGTPGDAAFVRDKLTALGFAKFEVGNASNQDNKVTQIAFSSTVPGEIKMEIQKELEKNYQTVQVGGTVSGDSDIKIVTGPRKGATPKPTATSTPKPTATATPKPSTTPTPTPSPTQ